MSRYITTKQYKAAGLCGEYLVIHYGEALEERDGTLFWNGKAVCAYDSDNGFRHFSWDEDGRGLERGALTYAIAYGDHDMPVALSDEENRLFRQKWPQYLRTLSDANIVNADFFTAPVDTLESIAKDLHFVRRKNRYYYTGTGPDEMTGGNSDVRNRIGGDGSPSYGQTNIHYPEISEWEESENGFDSRGLRFGTWGSLPAAEREEH